MGTRQSVRLSFGLSLSRPSVAEKLELSRRYWQQQGISDWGIIIDKEDTSHEESDILAAESGEHVRVLLCREEQSYVVSCQQHFRMPYPVASDLLAELQPVPAETYSVFVLDEDITNRQREGRNRKLDLIAPVSGYLYL